MPAFLHRCPRMEGPISISTLARHGEFDELQRVLAWSPRTPTRRWKNWIGNLMNLQIRADGEISSLAHTECNRDAESAATNEFHRVDSSEKCLSRGGVYLLECFRYSSQARRFRVRKVITIDLLTREQLNANTDALGERSDKPRRTR